MKNIIFETLFLFFCAASLYTGNKNEANQVIFTSSNLPIIIINTFGRAILNEPKIPAEMKIIYNGEGKRNNLTDSVYNYNGLIGIELRGESTQLLPKKQYGIETRDSLGENLDVSLLGLPADNDWVLSAPYQDKTMMRDFLAYTLTRSMGRYASRAKYCEVVLNGEYMGVYILFEKVKRGKNRVNISKLNSTDISGDAVTGGYIIERDRLPSVSLNPLDSLIIVSHYQSNFRQPVYYQFNYPKLEDIVVQQKRYVYTFIDAFESVMASSSYADTLNGYPKYLDVSSTVDYVLINELAKNIDEYRYSFFFYKDRDSKNPKIFMGPVWDFNIAFGDADYYGGASAQGWQLTYYLTRQDFYYMDNQHPQFWWKRLYDDSLFMKKMKVRWNELRQNQFKLNTIYRYIDSLAVFLDEAQQRNFTRWPILNTYIRPNAFVGGSYANEITYLKNWINSRMSWMDLELKEIPAGVEKRETFTPVLFSLNQNYPNPFNPVTTISFFLSSRARVKLTISDPLGRTVETIVAGELPAGNHYRQWNSAGFASGVYFYRLTAGEYTETKKLVLFK